MKKWLYLPCNRVDCLKLTKMNFTLNVKETGNKSGKFHYTVTDESGSIISERKSNREYVACSIHGTWYFGRLDLIGKGDHGNHVKACINAGKEPTPIAYLKI